MGSPQTLTEAERRIVAAWAADCAERALELFEAEAPHDSRPRDSIARTRGFARGELAVPGEIRRRFVGGGRPGRRRALITVAAGGVGGGVRLAWLGMRIAVVADIHGNAPALRATLAEIDAEHVDAVVVCGDTAAGPLVTASLEMLATRPEPVHWVRGNGERETVACFDGVELQDASSGWAPWTARELERVWRDRMASWPIALELDGVCFCHGSPRADDENLTRATPPEVLAAAVADTSAGLIIGGHTHQQYLRTLPDGRVMVNAGSVGLPYEGRPGAFWMMVTDRRPELRETRYDVQAATDELRASGFPDLDEAIRESLIAPVDSAWVTAFFEHQAGRGEHPGDPYPSEPSSR